MKIKNSAGTEVEVYYWIDKPEHAPRGVIIEYLTAYNDFRDQQHKAAGNYFLELRDAERALRLLA